MSEPIRVLAVDDDPDVLSLTQEFLSHVHDGLDVETAVGGEAALAAVEAAGADIDCIVSDYDMPELDGLAFLRAVREDHPDVPFILFTGKGSEEIASEAIAAGVTDYLQKSGGSEQYEMLANRIVNAATRRRAERRATDLDRINRVIRRVQRGLVAAETRAEVERLVCDEFASADPYEYAWIGTRGEAGALEPRVTSGSADEQLETAIETIDPVTRRRGPGAVAARTGEPQAVQDIQTDPGFAPWRAAIGEAGLHSLCAIPLTYDDAEYGVLVVYADRPHAFDDEEREVLAEVGDTIGRAIDAVETATALDFVNEVVEGVSAGVAAYDADGRFVYVNPAFAALLDYTVDELLATPVWEVAAGLDESAYDDYWASFDPEETRHVETAHVTATGDRLPVETTTTPVEIEGQTYHVGTIRDISERVAGREELERYARRFEAVFDDPSAFIGLLEPDGTVMQVNENALSFADVTQDEVVGEPFWETPWWAWSASVQDAVRGHVETAAAGEFVRFEAENRGAAATSVTLDTTIRPVTDDDGEVVALIAEGRNITDRKHLEDQLRRSRNALQELYAASSTPGTTFEERLEDVLSTGCTHLDLPLAALVERVDDDTLRVVGTPGLPDLEVGDEIPITGGFRAIVEDDGSVLAIPDMAAADIDTSDAEARDVRSAIGVGVQVDGEQHGMLWFAGREPRPNGFSAFERTFVELLARWASDELERERTTRQLERQNDRLERFADIVTHDLRSPLTSAQGWLDMARGDHDDDRLDKVASSLDRMDELVDDIRTMTWSGRDVAHTAPFSLATVAASAWETVGQTDATLEIADDVGRIVGDEGRTRQLLENLFRNSVEHGSTSNRDATHHDDSVEHGSTGNRDAPRPDDSVERAGPTVTVQLDALPDGFTVSDDGPGIPAAERDVVFDHGYTTTEQGTGFGLNIVREAAHAHGWDVSVGESDTGGARFEIRGVDRVDD